MFCSNCGAMAPGNFCSKCGARLEHASDSSALLQDWAYELRYESLIRILEVREKISRHAGMAKKGLSGEDFLAFADKLVPLGFSLEKLGAALLPIYAKLGIKTGKNRAENFFKPPGTVIVSILCSLARRGQVLEQVRQFEDGCLMEATLPSDLWSWAGVLLVSIEVAGEETHVDAATKIKGQIFDWGKSTRCLDALFSDIDSIPA